MVLICRGLRGFRHTELSLIGQVRELFRLRLLVLGLKDVLVNVGDEATVQVFAIASCTLVDFGKGQGRVLPHCEDVIAEMSDPKSAQLLILRLGLLGKRSHEAATCDACRISHRPTLVLKAVDKGIKKRRDMLAEWLFLLVVDRYFVANLAYAVTGSLSHGMVIG